MISIILTNAGKNLMKTKDYFKKYFDSTRAVGETLDDETMAFRISNMEMMLMSGIPLAKLDSMRPTLEKHGKQKLTSSSNMRQLIPPMLQRELDCIMAECLGRDVVIIFDGTSKLRHGSCRHFHSTHLTPFHVLLTGQVSEVFAIVFRFVKDDFDIITWVVAVAKYERSFNHKNLVDAIIELTAKFNLDRGGNSPRSEGLVGQYNRTVRPGHVLSWMRDRCAVNYAAITILLRTYRGSKNMACLSHTLTHPGDHFSLRLLKKFKEDLCGLMHQSLAAAAYWVSPKSLLQC